MATQITITQTKSVVDIGVPPDTEYVFRLESVVVVDSSDTGFSEPEVFVVATADDSFQHTATLGDYLNFPNVKPAPPPPDYYRVDTVTLDFDNLADAVAEADLQLVRLQNLVTDWENYADNNWTGSTPTVITGD